MSKMEIGGEVAPVFGLRFDQRSGTTLALAMVALFSFFYLRDGWTVFFRRYPDEIYIIFACTLVAALFFHRVTYTTYPKAFSITARTTAIGVSLYLAIEPPEFTLADPGKSNLLAYVDNGYWFALAASVVGIWRPSFTFPAAFYAISTRAVVEQISGVSMSVLDIKYMMEMGQFLSLCACGLAVVRLVQSRFAATTATLDLEAVAVCLAFIAFGFHLANYFWSGLAKLTLGPHFWTWAWENQTQNIMVTALKKGVLPSGAFPGLTQWMFDGFGHLVKPSNLFVLAIQLFAIVAALRTRWLIASALAYDAFHIGIYVFGGLFFWPWIWNNGSIIVAVRGAKFGWQPKVCCIVSVLAGYSGYLGGAARLAWFDILDVKISTIQVQDSQGNWIDVPVSFFLSHSYSMSHGYYIRANEPGHYPFSLWGSVTDYDRQVRSGKCDAPGEFAQPESREERRARLEKLSRFIQVHHERRLETAIWPFGFYLRSHHHPSNPWLYHDFNRLDLSTVKRYRVVVQSVCLNLEKGKVGEREIKRDEIYIDVH
jgi:hypothetical protein